MRVHLQKIKLTVHEHSVLIFSFLIHKHGSTSMLPPESYYFRVILEIAFAYRLVKYVRSAM